MNDLFRQMREDSNKERSLRAQEDATRELKSLRGEQNQIAQATFAVVKEQQVANQLQKESLIKLEEQNSLLRKQNEDQVKQIARERKWNIFAWFITTAVAIASIVVSAIR